ncbi:iron-sulfur cluster assembly scaffold protein [Candidatus Woesearchaeota archaeon]|nr:iron-sulfur cluster assembly scaffold protein [Candidatus Woesearchaeota archaeon]
MLHAENIREHARKPRNKRIIPEPTATKMERNPFCGDELEVSVIVDEGKIKDIAFQGKGCAISQAAMSMLTKKLQGKKTDEILTLSGEKGREYVTSLLGIPIGPVRMKCALLGLRTVQEALR